MQAPRPERLFLALWPEPPVRRALAALARERVPPGLGRRVGVANLHLTLLFLGGLDASARERLEAACGAIAFAPFTLRLSRTGVWPGAGVAWSAPRRSPPALLELARALRDAAAACGIAVEPRPFRAHVTLARRLPRDPSRAARIAGEHSPIVWSARRFALVRSESGPRAPVYRVLVSWPGADASPGSARSVRGAGGGASVE